MKRQFDLDAELVRGNGGVFVVSVDNEKIFSKADEHRFPAESEIVEKIRELRG